MTGVVHDASTQRRLILLTGEFVERQLHRKGFGDVVVLERRIGNALRRIEVEARRILIRLDRLRQLRLLRKRVITLDLLVESLLLVRIRNREQAIVLTVGRIDRDELAHDRHHLGVLVAVQIHDREVVQHVTMIGVLLIGRFEECRRVGDLLRSRRGDACV